MACDGVWDVLTDEVAAALVFETVEKGGGVEGAAQVLVDTSLQKGSTDNVTVHVIGLKGTEEQQVDLIPEPIAVGSVADALAMMESTTATAAASAAAPGSAGGEYLKKKKKRKGKRIGAGAAEPQGSEERSPGGTESSPETSPGFGRTEMELDVTQPM